jgi:5-methylcytosine-specific restriction endonuclease McrA
MISEVTRQKMRDNYANRIARGDNFSGFKKGHGLLRGVATKEEIEVRSKKISIALIGRTLSEETKRKVSENARHGADNHFWRGGITSPERLLWHSRQRRVKKLGNGGSHSQEEWEALKSMYEYKCPCCGRSEPLIKLTVDHVIPLSKGGLDDISNIQPLCKSCNSKKHTDIVRYEHQLLTN